MSLRNALKSAVARCTPLEMQHATFAENHATGNATGVQLIPANPHGITAFHATDAATGMQPASATHATQTGSDEKLQVAFAGTCNTQPGALTAHRVTAALLKAAMRACDQHGDSESARQQMRADCLELPPHLQADLLAHFLGERPVFTSSRKTPY